MQHLFESCGLQCEQLSTGAFTARMLQKLLWASVLWLVCHAHGGITVRALARRNMLHLCRLQSISMVCCMLVYIIIMYIQQAASSCTCSRDNLLWNRLPAQEIYMATSSRMQVGQACAKHEQDISKLIFELYPIAQLYALEAVPAYMQHYMQEPQTVQDVLQQLLAYSHEVADAVPSWHMARTEFGWRNGFFLWRQPTAMHIELLREAGCDDLAIKAQLHDS